MKLMASDPVGVFRNGFHHRLKSQAVTNRVLDDALKGVEPFNLVFRHASTGSLAERIAVFRGVFGTHGGVSSERERGGPTNGRLIGFATWTCHFFDYIE